MPPIRTLAALLFVATVNGQATHACSVALTPGESDRQLRELLRNTDYLLIGHVDGITRRRWGPDDELGSYEKRLLGWQAEGRRLSAAQMNLLEFSEATARLRLHISMMDDDIDRFRSISAWFPTVEIYLLRPIVGPGSCTAFPSTCPWDLKSGEFVAIALNELPFGQIEVQYCIRTNLPNRAASERIETLR